MKKLSSLFPARRRESMPEKKLVILNGAMGVGKTTVSEELAGILKPCVFLDGDWCWMSKPFINNEQTQAMVLDNVLHLLRNFLSCPQYEYVIFCWVLHRAETLDYLLAQLSDLRFRADVFTLTAPPEVIRTRLEKDIHAHLREPDVIARSLDKLPLYDRMKTIKIDTASLTPRQVADRIAETVLWK